LTVRVFLKNEEKRREKELADAQPAVPVLEAPVAKTAQEDVAVQTTEPHDEFVPVPAPAAAESGVEATVLNNGDNPSSEDGQDQNARVVPDDASSEGSVTPEIILETAESRELARRSPTIELEPHVQEEPVKPAFEERVVDTMTHTSSTTFGPAPMATGFANNNWSGNEAYNPVATAATAMAGMNAGMNAMNSGMAGMQAMQAMSMNGMNAMTGMNGGWGAMPNMMGKLFCVFLIFLH